MSINGHVNDLYENFIMEIRPRLRSVNVFIKLKAPLKNFKISFDDNKIVITDENVRYNLPPKNVVPVPETLTCLLINDKCLSFRFSTNCVENFGTFKSEILSLHDSDTNVCVEPFLTRYVTYNVCCSNCSQVLCKDVGFERILPLPSEHSEPSDWFCHAHVHTDGTAPNLDPKLNDVFYSICSVHVNSKLLDGVVKTPTNVVCKRCLSWLGVVLNENSLKVWFNTVNFNERIVSHGTDALADVYLTLRSVLRESLVNSTRIVVQCRVSKDQTDYVLLWVMEKKLNVVMDDEDGVRDFFVAKVLFRFESGASETVNQWMNDVVISNVNVSKPMMVELIKHLYQMNRLFPHGCGTSNEFYISYLPLYGT